MFGGSRSHGGTIYGDTWTFDGTEWQPKLEYQVSPVNGNLYALTPPMTWTNAEALAVQEGGHLATVRSQAEQDWLWKTFGGPTANVWIGLNDPSGKGKGHFVWSSGESASWRNWAIGQPNNTVVGNRCHLWYGASGKWGDDPNSNLYPAIIELPGGPTHPATWADLQPANAPAPRDRAAMANDANGLVLFGGDANGMCQGDTWTFDGTDWTQQFPRFNPTWSCDAAMAFDPVRDLTVMFGGEDPLGTPLADTWVWDGANWSWQNITGPAARSDASIAFDAARGVNVLFGGHDAASQPFADTWSFDGTAWTQLTPATTSPPARYDHAMAFDASRKVIVLHGGKDGNGDDLADVWEWDGSDWTDVTPAGSFGPSAQSGHVLVYDPPSERVALVGGNGGSWSWDGKDWTILVAQGSAPPARTHTVAAYLPGKRVVMFGGDSGGTALDDTWSLSMRLFARFTNFGQGCASSATPTALSATTPPKLGSTFGLRLSNLGSLTPGILLFGFSDKSWGGISLPLDLAFLGMNGCNLLVSWNVEVNFTSPRAGGVLDLPLPIPTNPTLEGLTFYNQAWVLDPKANAFGVGTSNGGKGVIGY